MCGRYTLTAPKVALADLFQLVEAFETEARYNIAPTQNVAAIRAALDGKNRELVRLRWGLIPSWSADTTIGARLINARAETAADKPSFRTAFRRRRCLIPADGVYEWQKLGGKKQPVYFRLREGGVFAFAGLWEEWKSPTETIASCTILTTTANALVAPLHERMPVILDPANYEPWLDPQIKDPQIVQPFLQPFPAEAMTAYPVNSIVNNARNETPRCIEPASPEA